MSVPETASTDRAAILETLRWKKFPVLNDGFVALVDCMGDDGSVVQAARVSYGEGTRKVSDDRQLIRYLIGTFPGHKVAAIRKHDQLTAWYAGLTALGDLPGRAARV